MEKIENAIENSPEINWVRPNIDKERGELKRVVKDFLAEELTVDKLEEILEQTPIEELSEEAWSLLENTDSFHNVKLGEIDFVRELNDNYNKELEDKNKRDLDSLLNAFKSGYDIESPMIVKNKEGRLHLISGNTRLMISRALGLIPKVIIGEVGNNFQNE